MNARPFANDSDKIQFRYNSKVLKKSKSVYNKCTTKKITIKLIRATDHVESGQIKSTSTQPFGCIDVDASPLWRCLSSWRHGVRCSLLVR